MGGGDLNSKKAWHPNTMKNQERVWKAEQAAAEEKKRIVELQRERALERDREDLNKIARGTSNSTHAATENQLHWMYDKPDKKVQHEDYLLGKAIDKNYEQAGKSEQHEIPAVSRRVVGSSMLAAGGDVQVDLARKLREDPLLLVKERERAARAAVLNNPVQRSKLTELLRKEQELKNAKSELKLKKKDKELDNMLAAKLHALSSGKGVDLAKLLAADDSSSDESSVKEKKRKKKKNKDKKKKKDKKKNDSDNEIVHKNKKAKKNDGKDIICKNYSEASVNTSSSSKHRTKYSPKIRSSNKRKSTNSDSDVDEPLSKNRKTVSLDKNNEKERKYRESRNDDKYRKETSESETRKSSQFLPSKKKLEQKPKKPTRIGLSEEEKAAKLAEMAAAGAEREIQRGQRVAKQLSEIAADERTARLPRSSHYSEARALPDSLEDRIHSNRHYIQRDRLHMNEHFARR